MERSASPIYGEVGAACGGYVTPRVAEATARPQNILDNSAPPPPADSPAHPFLAAHRKTRQHRPLSVASMSYDQLSSLESGGRAGYSDDPPFQQLQHQLRSQLQTLLSGNRKLANDVSVLGTRRDTPRLRERVHGSMDKTRDLCREIGDGVKRLQTWDDLSVGCLLPHPPPLPG